MRWEALFDDLETQAAASERLDFDAEVAERARLDGAAVELGDRLRGSLGVNIRVRLTMGTVLEGTVGHVGRQALVLLEPRHQILVPYTAVIQYTGLGRLAVTEPPGVHHRLSLASSLRGLARDRSLLSVLVTSGQARPEEPALHGVIDRVGQDFLDLALIHAGEDRRAANVRDVATIPFQALAGIRSARAAVG
ncbi:hypothetical protein [Arthrobacter oryzae]|uniref:Uncharacterized protein n=2 Tax=Arthrobacter TaxID=1663 RepID=A0A3N0C402_9MICC|nr:hypothetical protein [Arthrobacter oryzae]QYF91560.1 hypothetical protein KY499_16840 [Arthrobacter sp. PAMC25284]RNL57078.1 hypothetical protein D7003_07830 [Arthrobacter oryzae]